jgi:dienelactone hydrolase
MTTRTESGSPPTWEQRFRASRYTLPAWAKSNPGRCAFVTDLPGVIQVYCWDRDTAAVRQVTDRVGGSRHCAIEASGEHVWWFADRDGDECGVWMRQPFGGGPDRPVAPSMEPAAQAGLAMGLRGHALLGRSTDDGTEIHLLRPDGSASSVYRHEEPAAAGDLSRALDLLAVTHTESGDLWRPAVRLLRPDGSLVADLGADGDGMDVVGFAPLVGDPRLLLQRLRDGRWEPVVFDPRTGAYTEIRLGLPGDVDVEWYQDGAALLVVHTFHARSELYRCELAAPDRLVPLDVPPGTVEHARTRPDGDVWYLWSSTAHAPRFRSLHGTLDVPVPITAPDSVPIEDAWVAGPGGPVHALISRPTIGIPPYPTVFLLHGGPDEHDSDAFDPETAAWNDSGFAVVRVNYRGSTGYGEAWTEALRERVGHVELADVGAVRAQVLADGLADPERLILAGSSWGGYLTLLGLGVQPADWTLGIARAPVADCALAYEDERDDVRALDRALFGGSPDEVPDRYRDSSPSTYVNAVRAPVFVFAGVNDPYCPERQIRRYVARLAELSLPHEVYWHRSGHSSTAVDERVEMFRAAMAFVRAHLPAARQTEGAA